MVTGADGFLPRLAPPPRRVPLSWRLRLLFGGPGLFAWLWLAFAGGMGTIFLAQADLFSWVHFLGKVERAEGTSEGCEATQASSNKQRIYANHYRFEVPDLRVEAGGRGPAELTGTSYGRCAEAGSTVTVEWPAGHPERSRIVGQDRATFGPEVAFVAIFPLVGILFVAATFVAGLRQLALLEHGRLTVGTLLSKTPVTRGGKGPPVWACRFALETERGKAEITIRTTRPERLEDDPREKFVYDPRRADRAVAWDDLDPRPRVDGLGAFEPLGVGPVLLALLGPLLAGGAIVAVVKLLG